MKDEKEALFKEDDLRRELHKFWEMEAVGTSNVDQVYEQFKLDITFNGERYVTKLPFKPHADTIPDNFSLSFKRLQSLEKKFSCNPKLKEQYQEIITSYEEDKIIERVTSPGSPGKVHYLPHRAVVKDGKKIRIVFDGSAKMEGPSINDSLYKGPCLLTSIYDILLRFRLYPIGIIADIRQAFLNIAVSEEHRDFLRFLWQENQDLIIYRFLRVLFGLTSSPFLLNGTVQYHMEPYRTENPELTEKFLRNLYVDDSINGVKSVKEGVEFYKFVKACMRDAAFDMRKWYTNSGEL